MDFYRRNPVFYSLLLALLALGLVGVWHLSRVDSELQDLKRSYRSKSAQYDRYLAARPSPTRSNLETLARNYSELYEAFEETLRVMNLNTYDREAFFGQTPVSRADWSFELHKFKENARHAALSERIELPANVQFGFEGYAEGGPLPAEMQRVHEQMVIMSALLRTLFDSGIQSFVKIQRGHRSDSGQAPIVSRRGGERLFNDGDEFVMSPAVSSAVPGVIDAYAFRVAFRGQSLALRTFLNRLVDSSLPFVIRGVEVDLASEGGAKHGFEKLAEIPLSEQGRTPVSRQASSVPIISDNMSLFVVTVEFLELAADIEPPPMSQGEESSPKDA